MTHTLSTNRLGRTRLEVPAVGLGTAPLAGLYAPIPEERARETVEYCLANGVTFFDTAPFYGAGESERRLGAALAGVPRDAYVLATKVGRLISPDGSVTFDFSRDGVLRSLEASLERLRLDRVDILHIHDPDDYPDQALTEAFPALADLRSRGVIGAVGAGMNQAEMLARFAREADFDCFLLAGRYTLLEQGALDELFPLCREKGIGIILGGVLNSGILATGAVPGAKYEYADAPAEVLDRVARVEAVCARHGVPLRVAALRFPTAHPAVTALLTGAESPRQVEDNLAALRTPIPADLWTELEAEGLLRADAPAPT
jgi:D-threo-aldose 1-dehydrogenase